MRLICSLRKLKYQKTAATVLWMLGLIAFIVCISLAVILISGAGQADGAILENIKQ